ncbi:hypothetical protein [Sphingomonas sp.]|uniref:hypothetical protein n=1 Tax=Sphingomonas sp. TaxID=28214 RepID=UPI001859484A|nr:hypothetical protein [Sphingomonas sp.]MBA3510674.1 hypothetical protein [Sphingomonas sp.]
MTFKSIETILAEAEVSGALKRFEPAFDEDECEKRRLYLSKDTRNRIYNHPAHQRDYFANVRAVLKEYVIGEEIEDDEQFFKRLTPRRNPHLTDIWEIKITFAPKARIFGAFAGQDCFVAITSRLRDKCPFEDAMEKVHYTWNRLFPGHPRFRCWPLDQCITDCGGYT